MVYIIYHCVLRVSTDHVSGEFDTVIANSGNSTTMIVIQFAVSRTPFRKRIHLKSKNFMRCLRRVLLTYSSWPSYCWYNGKQLLWYKVFELLCFLIFLRIELLNAYFLKYIFLDSLDFKFVSICNPC